jgi:hypothetical protein
MQRPERLLRPALLMAAGLALTPGMAWAYIDPNASGFLFQLLFPIITAVGAAFVFLRQRLWDIVKRIARLGRAQQPAQPKD